MFVLDIFYIFIGLHACCMWYLGTFGLHMARVVYVAHIMAHLYVGCMWHICTCEFHMASVDYVAHMAHLHVA